jgi:chorismate mutase
MKISGFQSSIKPMPLSGWLPDVPYPVIISGPCSAESYDQIMQTAYGLHRTGMVAIFRSEVRKPRTRPDKFEGKGKEALKWLQEVKKKFGMMITVEVATPEHIDQALLHDVDILWIGARTTVNPFSVQQLADSLKGIDIPVLVKNPVNPDLELWIGVLERIYNTGINKIAAVHRGFNVYEKTPYRNAPLWDIPVQLKSLFPELPVFCDPSHIAGNRDLIHEIAQKALFLDMNGLMIESHFNPNNALTDPSQQIMPETLNHLIENLKIPRQYSSNPCREVELLRTKIDDLDYKWIQVLAERFDLVREIAAHKKDCKIPVLQVSRWNEILKTRLREAEKMGVNKELIELFLQHIHKESINIQAELLKS